MRQKIVLSLLAVFIFFLSGTVVAIFHINNTTKELGQLIKLHQVEDMRQHLIMSIQTTQSDLYTVNTPLGQTLDSIVGNVSHLSDNSDKCLSCHHRPEVTMQINEVRSLVQDYMNALSYYITASANSSRIDRIKMDAAGVGNNLLLKTEQMSLVAGNKLGQMTSAAMTRINKAKTILYFTVICAFFFGAIVSVRLTMSVTKPVTELVKATRMIASGNLDYNINYRDTTEFGELAANFNSMSSELKNSYAKLQEEIAERKITGDALAKSEAFLNTIFHSIGDPLYIVDRYYKIARLNEAYTLKEGSIRKDLVGLPCYEALKGRGTRCEHCIVEKTFISGSQSAMETLETSHDGKTFWAEVHSYPIFDSEGGTAYVIQHTRDITERKLAEEALRESTERYALAARGANDGLWDWDLKTDKIYFSPRWKSMLGYDENEIGNTPEEWFNLVHPDDRNQLETKLASHKDNHSTHFESEHRILHKDRSYKWTLNRGLAVRDMSGRAYRMAGSQTDITERKMAEAQLIYDAFHDALTGLPNRALFFDRLSHVMRSRKRHPDTIYAVLFLDMNRFKVVNDSMGHMAGDQLLVAVSQRLLKCLRAGDTLARLGGDEFAILLENIRDVSDATEISDRIQGEFRGPFMLGEREVFSTASIGIAISSDDYERPEQVLRDADIAMYQAKAVGTPSYAIFTPTMYTRTLERMELETDLRRAVERMDFIMHYQPIIDLDINRIAGFEALIRWRHPQRGLIYPLQFIPLAEETGLIVPIGQWIIEECCSQLKRWQDKYETDPPLRVSVNISTKQLSQADLIVKISNVLRTTGIDPRCLALEITESIIMENSEAANEMMLQLKEMGVHIHIDDFGTGYSSLSYIHRFPANALKIDRSFVNKMSSSKEKMEIIRTIITLAHSLDMNVIAEGVELDDQLSQFKELKCRYGQGFLFAKPMCAEDIDSFITMERPFTV